MFSNKFNIDYLFSMYFYIEGSDKYYFYCFYFSNRIFKINRFLKKVLTKETKYAIISYNKF